MAAFLSDGWLDELAARLAPVRLDARLVVGVEVEHGDDATQYQVIMDAAGTTLERSPSAPADVTLALDEDGARRLADGDTTAQELLLEGRLKLRGDAARLLGSARQVGALTGGEPGTTPTTVGRTA